MFLADSSWRGRLEAELFFPLPRCLAWLDLAPMLRAAMDNGLVGATLFEQAWSDVGTPERLAEINNKAF